MAVTATVMATMPATSILTGLTRPGADGRKATPEAIAAAPKGRLIQNAHRQPSPSVSHPPRTGPSIADSANTAPTTLIEAARSRAGTTSAMMAWIKISKPPPPSP
jgi:hypothetical protein